MPHLKCLEIPFVEKLLRMATIGITEKNNSKPLYKRHKLHVGVLCLCLFPKKKNPDLSCDVSSSQWQVLVSFLTNLSDSIHFGTTSTLKVNAILKD